jgi:hypothetical protein
MTYPNCLYCGKVQDGTQACGCYSPKIENYYNGYESTSTLTIKPIYMQDLLSVANQLPKIPNMNHEKLILDAYRNGGWKSADAYIEFVVELSKEMGVYKPNKSLYRKIMDFVADCTIKVILWIKKIV